ncbi:hypothetical protein SDC9_191418 [bioreactor metagenome]|uniref:Uncharacterized protein n=1 Tax=bioreactor metagenome TaxID=1076179 RepID=A0A645HXX9_9ZZZZ
MNGEHLDIQVHSGGNGFSDRIGNIVEFEIEEDLSAALANLTDDVRSGAGEELAADFERTHVRGEFAGQAEGIGGVRYIQGDNDRVAQHA